MLALCDTMPARYRAFVTIAAGTGMRRADNPIWGQPKTESSTRTIPVGDVVVDAIWRHVNEFGHHESGLLFTTDYGAFVGTSTLHGARQRAARKAGTMATPHDLRHYFASIQIRSGQSIKVLEALLGHKSAVETWDTNGHLMGDEDTGSRAVIDAALGGQPRNGASADG